MKICFIDAKIFLDKPELLDPLRPLGEIEAYEGIPETADEVVARAGDADVIAFALMQFTHEMIDRLPNLKILQFIGTGMWNFVDVEYAQSKGIKVLNIEGYGSNAVAEFGVSMAMALNRKIAEADRILKAKTWDMEGLCGMEIAGSTVGVAGTGNIGRMVAEKYLALGADVVACDIFENESLKEKGVKYVTFEEMFAAADIVSLHMKVTKDNERCINKALFDLMKPNALLINVARAELVDTDALYEALAEGKIAGAAIDVYNAEPPSEKDYRLAGLKNVIATPHIGFYTEQANDNSIIMSVDSIIKALNE